MCTLRESYIMFCVCRERNKRRLKEIVNEYTLTWRGLIGTEYAAQTQLPPAWGASGSGRGLS